MNNASSSVDVKHELRAEETPFHWYRNVFSHAPRQKVRQVAAMLKAIHAQEEEGKGVNGRLKARQLAAPSRGPRQGINDLMEELPKQMCERFLTLPQGKLQNSTVRRWQHYCTGLNRGN